MQCVFSSASSSSNLTELALFLSIAIQSVHVGAHSAEFVHNDPIVNLTAGVSEPDCHRHPELKRKLYSALQEGDEGELAIAIPNEVSLKPVGSVGATFNDCEFPSFSRMNLILIFTPKFLLLNRRVKQANQSRNSLQ